MSTLEDAVIELVDNQSLYREWLFAMLAREKTQMEVRVIQVALLLTAGWTAQEISRRLRCSSALVSNRTNDAIQAWLDAGGDLVNCPIPWGRKSRYAREARKLLRRRYPALASRAHPPQ